MYQRWICISACLSLPLFFFQKEKIKTEMPKKRKLWFSLISSLWKRKKTCQQIYSKQWKEKRENQKKKKRRNKMKERNLCPLLCVLLKNASILFIIETKENMFIYSLAFNWKLLAAYDSINNLYFVYYSTYIAVTVSELICYFDHIQHKTFRISMTQFPDQRSKLLGTYNSRPIFPDHHLSISRSCRSCGYQVCYLKAMKYAQINQRSLFWYYIFAESFKKLLSLKR